MRILVWLCGCHHRLSRVWTRDGRSYKVCTECGSEIEYDLSRMQPLRQRKAVRAQLIDEVLKRA